MKKLRYGSAAAVFLLSVVPAGLAQVETRGLWVSRFEWPSSNKTACQNTLENIMATLEGAHFNAVFLQIRGQADVLYPSPYEVWSPLIGGRDPGWDPLAYAIERAHAHGLEFHAYFNTHTCWQGTYDPGNLEHLYYKHCNAADPQARDWLIHDSNGQPVSRAEDTYVWLAPGVPAFQSYLRQQVMYLVEHYDLDGIHFDRIRTPNSLYSYDPISMARLADPQSNPRGLGFHEWTSDQITRNVRDIYAAIMAVKPWVKVSAAVFPDPDSAPTYQHQDAAAWLAAGALDFVVPMDYSGGGAGSRWDLTLQQWLARRAGRHVVMGQHASNTFDELYAQIQLVRARGGAGTNLFSWTKLYPSLLNSYRDLAYPTVEPTPAMPWKQNPSVGIVQGFVRDLVGNTIVDAQVVRSGSAYVALSSGDGYYSHLLVPPGSYSLEASHPDYEPATVADVAVAAGEVKRQDIVFTVVKVPKAKLAADTEKVIIEDAAVITPRAALPAGDEITAWTLDFGDGETREGVGLPSPATHVYAELGAYDVTFTMTTSLHGTVSPAPLRITVVPKPPIPGDFDGDRDVDQSDFGAFQVCLAGSVVPQTDPACAGARLDGDEDVDYQDLAIFMGCISGPGQLGKPDCNP